MLIALQKQKENIAEYVLYMYQIEDLIRAYDFNLEAIMENFVKPQLTDVSQEEEYKNWYRDLISQMKSQRIEKQGHLHDLKDILVEISYLHNTLLNLANDEKYRTLVETGTTFIDEFKERSNLKEKNNIEVLFHAMYMKLLLKLQGKEISAETEEAFDSMRIQLAYLAKSYHKMKSGDLNFLNN